jgi:hypothetical protein
MKRIRRIIVLSLLLCGAPAIFIVLGIPGWWLYDELALRKAFGAERHAGVKIERITKPYTVTFSNGKTVDVGSTPANMSNLFHIGTGVPAVLAYVYFIKRRGPAWFRRGNWARRGASIVED